MKFYLFLFSQFSCLIIIAQTFSGTFNQIIPDNGTTVSFPITVSGLPTIIDASFGIEVSCVNITHTYDADLDIKLRSPDGTIVTLITGIGGGDDNFVNTCLNDVGMALGSGTAPFTGSFHAMGLMGNFNNGQNPNGIWELLCNDSWAIDEGTLHDWSLTFSNSPAQPFGFGSSIIPIVKLTTLGSSINNNTKVPVHMQIIDNGPGQINYVNQTIYAYEGDILTEWQGFTGPTYPKKNYDFDLIDSGGNKLDTSLLGMPAENDWIFKAEHLDHSLLKNTVSYEFARRMGQYAPKVKPCEIILDGQYIGYYSLTEKVKRSGQRVDISKLTTTDTSGIELTGGYIIEMNINGDPGAWNSDFQPINNATCGLPVEFKYVYPKPDVIASQQALYIHDYVDSFEYALDANSYMDSEIGYRKWIDVSTFIDFLLVNEFSMNYDSYGRSTYMYKEKETDGGKLKIGPPWDYDRAMASNPTSGWVWENTHPGWPFPFWWSKFYTDSVYTHELACRWKSLRADVFQTTEFISFIDSMAGIFYQGPADRNFTVWQTLGGATYVDQVENLKTFISQRLDWMDNTLAPFGAVLPIVIIPEDTTVCMGANFIAPYLPNVTYNWIPGPSQPNILLMSPGLYQLEVTDIYGCSTISNMNIQLSIPNSSFNVIHITQDLNYLFSAVDNQLETYQWNFGDWTNPQISNYQESYIYANPGIYSVSLTVSDSLSCTSTSTQNIQVINAEVQFEINPNPIQSNSQVFHNIPPNDSFEFILFDAMGRKVKIWENPVSPFSLDVMQNRNGMYWIECNYNQQSISKKILKY